MIKRWQNKMAAITVNTTPTLTDQSQASETDRNVIVHKFLQHGQIPAPRKAPTYADYSQLPQDLRGFLDQARSLERLRAQLPTQLRGYSQSDLLALTPQQLKDILTPPAPSPAPAPAPKPAEGDNK